MPQGRSKAFSGKKKKLQIQQKRNRTVQKEVPVDAPHVPKDTEDVGGSSIILGAAATDRRTLLSEDAVNLGARSGTGREVGILYVSQAYKRRFRANPRELRKLFTFRTTSLTGRNSTCDSERKRERSWRR